MGVVFVDGEAETEARLSETVSGQGKARRVCTDQAPLVYCGCCGEGLGRMVKHLAFS
jgi:hypothetical protein